MDCIQERLSVTLDALLLPELVAVVRSYAAFHYKLVASWKAPIHGKRWGAITQSADHSHIVVTSGALRDPPWTEMWNMYDLYGNLVAANISHDLAYGEEDKIGACNKQIIVECFEDDEIVVHRGKTVHHWFPSVGPARGLTSKCWAVHPDGTLFVGYHESYLIMHFTESGNVIQNFEVGFDFHDLLCLGTGHLVVADMMVPSMDSSGMITRKHDLIHVYK